MLLQSETKIEPDLRLGLIHLKNYTWKVLKRVRLHKRNYLTNFDGKLQYLRD